MTVALPPALVADFEALAGGELTQPPEWLGVRYEASRQGSLERRQGGAHYTPPDLIAPIVRVTIEPLLRGRNAAALLQLRIIDPAMGAGAFLAEACRVLAARLLELGGAPTLQEARRLVAMNCLHGVDLDPIAVMLARRVLWLVVGDASVALDAFDGQLRQGDALVGEGRRGSLISNFRPNPFTGIGSSLRCSREGLMSCLETLRFEMPWRIV